jgi:hypothetical protein
VTLAVSLTLPSPLLYVPPLTDQVKNSEAPPLHLEKWGLLVSSTQAEPGPIGGVPQALVGKLLLSPLYVNEFGSLVAIRESGRLREFPY